MTLIQRIGCMRRVNGSDILVESTVVLFTNGKVVICTTNSLGRVLGDEKFGVLPRVVLSVSAYKELIRVYKNARKATIEEAVLDALK